MKFVDMMFLIITICGWTKCAEVLCKLVTDIQ